MLSNDIKMVIKIKFVANLGLYQLSAHNFLA